MSAVSAESPRGSADLSTSVSSPQAADEQPSTGAPGGKADFGPNQWLVDELYQRYQADPGSVDHAWWSIFADYQPQPEAVGQPAPRVTEAPAQAGAATGRPADGPGAAVQAGALSATGAAGPAGTITTTAGNGSSAGSVATG